ncbi:MAG TPA: peptidyl-prolyl cis-trans isomerase [Polyangiaceae bacterium]|nr:peptidyl-prolyl cis-trans isomerase [Polyangiaceae bacterium]
MSSRRALAVSAALALAAFGAFTSSRSSADAGAAAALVRVGNASLDAAEATRRLHALPSFQLASFGDTPAEIRRNFVERVLVPELAADQEADRLRLRARPELRESLQRIQVQALAGELTQELSQRGAVSEQAIREYYETQRARFETPPRLRIWRIAVRDETLAKSILTEARGPEGVKKWNNLAREKSEDKATHLRDGDLGFVRADGSTDVPELRVDPVLFAAADKVRDGELVPEPIREGERWAVVWRRGSLPAVKRTLEQESAAIGQLLAREKLEKSFEKLEAQLRKSQVRDVDYELLQYVGVDAFGDVAERQRPGILPRRRARSEPEKGDRGYR